MLDILLYYVSIDLLQALLFISFVLLVPLNFRVYLVNTVEFHVSGIQLDILHGLNNLFILIAHILLLDIYIYYCDFIDV